MAVDPALEVADGRLGADGAVARSQNVRVEICSLCSVPGRTETSG